jgi:hypothetical protein
MNTSSNDNINQGGEFAVDTSPIPLLQDIQARGRVWEDLAAQYGVTNPDPPWKITLEATCDLLAGDSCVKPYDQVAPGSCALPSLERRAEEDELSATIYEDVPFPERQLLALAHSMIKHGLVNEEELARRMKEVGERLNSA